MAEEALRSTSLKANFHRLTRLLMRGGVQLLRETLDSIHSPADLDLKLADPAIQAQLRGARLTRPEWVCLNPSPGVYGKSNDFDITLIFKLFRTICGLTPPPGLRGWDDLPNDSDYTLVADLVRIKYFRNEIYGHCSTMEISDIDFIHLWEEISEALLRIARNISPAKRDQWDKSIDDLLRNPLTPDEKRCIEELETWYMRDMDLKNEFVKLRERLREELTEGLREELIGGLKEELRQGLREELRQGLREELRSQRPACVVIQIKDVAGSEPTFLAPNLLLPEPEQAAGADDPEPNNPPDIAAWNVILSFKESVDLFFRYLSYKLHLLVRNDEVGSWHITVECSSLQVLEGLWEDYRSGHLNSVAQVILITPQVLKKLGRTELKLTTFISEDQCEKVKKLLQASSVTLKQVLIPSIEMSNARRPTTVTRVIPVPKDKVGHVIGRRGSRIQEIREQTGVQISISKENQALLRGTVEQCQNAEKIIKEIVMGAQDNEKGGFKKLQVDIPDKFMGVVIGKGHETLNNISTKTGVTLKAFRGSPGLYFKGSREGEKKAIREIKAIVNLAIKRSRGVKPLARFVYVDTAQLEENHEFGLQKLQLDQVTGSGNKSFQLKLLEHPRGKETDDFADTDRLKKKIRGVLRQIHKEKVEEGEVKIEMKSLFGHAYITKIDEDEEEDTFTLKEIKEKIESTDGKSWQPIFKEGVLRMEVEAIERGLESFTSTEDIRYDFAFYTPSCRDIGVKAWLVEEHSEDEGATAPSLMFSCNVPIPVKNVLTRVSFEDDTRRTSNWLVEEHSEDEGATAASLMFSRNVPIPVKNVLTRVSFEDETRRTSNEPCFHIYSDSQQRMIADILMPSKGFDCRLSIRTYPNIPQTPEVEEENRILESYLMNMKIDQGQLKLPPNSELPDGFELFYCRRSLRRTYQCKTTDGEQFALTVCKEQAKDINIDHSDVGSFDETEVRTDIHLYYKKWDDAFDEGDWEPEQIVAKLPTFLKFLRKVQSLVAPHEEAIGGEIQPKTIEEQN